MRKQMDKMNPLELLDEMPSTNSLATVRDNLVKWATEMGASSISEMLLAYVGGPKASPVKASDKPSFTALWETLYKKFEDELDIYRGNWRNDAERPRRFLRRMMIQNAESCPDSAKEFLAGILTDIIEIDERRGLPVDQFVRALRSL